jgi:hypothetical protein
MRMHLIFLSIFFLAFFSKDANCNGMISCDEDKISQVMKSLEWSVSPETKVLLEQLARCPQEAVSYLVNELHEVPEEVIKPDELAEHPDTMHVIWCIRVLRYLTDGMKFAGKTARFDEYNEKLGGLPIGKEKDEVYFFSVWMSRDILYIAPKDAQADVIKKWKEWYANHAENFDFKSSKDFNEWYF